MSKTLTNRTLIGFLWLSGGKISNAIAQLIILGILARILSPSEFGLMGIALLIVSFSDIFSDIGMGPAITQKLDLSKSDVSTSFTFSIVFGLILFFTIYYLSPVLAVYFENERLVEILQAIAIVLFLKAISSTALGLLYRNLEYKKIAFVEVLSYIIGYGLVGVVLALLDYGVWSLVFGVISQSIISTILYLIYSKIPISLRFDVQSFKDLIGFGGGYSLGKIFTYFGNKGDKIIVGKMLGTTSLGLYERGYQLIRYIAGLIGEVIDKVLFSPLAKKQDDRELIGKIFLEITYLIALILMPTSIFLYHNSEYIVNILLGNQWGETITIVRMMSLSLFFLVCTRVGSTLAKSLGDVYNRALRSFFFACCIMIGTYFAIPWGVNGVAVCVSAAIGINYLLAFSQTKRLTKVSIVKFLECHLLGGLISGIYHVLFYFISLFAFTIIQNDALRIIISAILLIIVLGLGVLFDYKGIIKKYFKAVLKK